MQIRWIYPDFCLNFRFHFILGVFNYGLKNDLVRYTYCIHVVLQITFDAIDMFGVKDKSGCIVRFKI